MIYECFQFLSKLSSLEMLSLQTSSFIHISWNQIRYQVLAEVLAGLSVVLPTVRTLRLDGDHIDALSDLRSLLRVAPSLEQVFFCGVHRTNYKWIRRSTSVPQRLAKLDVSSTSFNSCTSSFYDMLLTPNIFKLSPQSLQLVWDYESSDDVPRFLDLITQVALSLQDLKLVIRTEWFTQRAGKCNNGLLIFLLMQSRYSKPNFRFSPWVLEHSFA